MIFCVVPAVSVSLVIAMTLILTAVNRRSFSNEVLVPLFLVSALYRFLGPFNTVVSVFPFYMAYPEVATWRNQRNRIMYAVELVSYLGLLGGFGYLFISGKLNYSYMRAITLTFSYIVVWVVRSFIFKRDFIDKERNSFLLQWEHDEMCCEKTIRSRASSGITLMEIAIFCTVGLLILVTWFQYVGDIDLTAVMLIPIMVMFWIAWMERNLHFYRDYSYALFYTVLVEVMLSLISSLYLSSVQGTGTDSGRIGLLVVYEILTLITARLFQRFIEPVVGNKGNAIMLLFPVQFYLTFFQFFLLLSIKDFDTAAFWIGWTIAVIFNIFEVTGLFSDIYLSVKAQYKRNRNNSNPPQPRDVMANIRTSFQMAAGIMTSTFTSVGNGGSRRVTDYTDTSVTDQLGLELGIDPDTLQDYSSLLKSPQLMNLTAMQQKAICLFLVSFIASIFAGLDLLISSLFENRNSHLTRSDCFIFCDLVTHHYVHRLTAIAVMNLCMSLMAWFIWKYRMSKSLTRMAVRLAQGQVDRKRQSEASDPGAKLPRAMLMELRDEEEWERLMAGHISRHYDRPYFIIFIICVIIHSCWTIVSKMVL